jgi:hypothetical protein
MNPITGAMEYNGTSLIDITILEADTVAHSWCEGRQSSVSVVCDYKHDGGGSISSGLRHRHGFALNLQHLERSSPAIALVAESGRRRFCDWCGGPFKYRAQRLLV